MVAEDGTPSGLGGRRILLGVTGGVAAYKAVFLARLLTGAGADVTVVMSQAATRFVGPATFAAVTRNQVHSDAFEQPEMVLHVRLAHQADVAVVAPATANVLAKLAVGLADDLLTSTLLEATCPLVLAPAMHTGMWEHPATRRSLAIVAGRGAVVVGPNEGPLAAGDQGAGRMAEPAEIFDAVLRSAAGGEQLGGRRALADRRILVTAGPTHEPIDPVRYIGNRSSGRMGYAVADEAARRGAEVTLVTGPVALADPPGVNVVRVETAEEMAAAVMLRYPETDAVVMAAAVADFRPNRAASGKLKKESGPPSLTLEPTTDILAVLGKRKEHQVLVGFAAETERLEAEGRRKLAEKNLDLLVANEVGRPGTGFGSETDRASILTRGGADVSIRAWTKRELAATILDRVAAMLRGDRGH
jgi:phosphopantothenoylcysteine decarboxylase/phosphopantothenate--cysteine ligase